MSEFLNIDCMEGMKTFPDKHFDLAICDPPYGLNMEVNAYNNGINCKANGFKAHLKKEWDNAIPKEDYFNELFRVSKNQIITGANYFTKYLPPTMAWIFWYKMQDNFSFSDGEFIFTSFQTKAKIFQYARGNESGFSPKSPFNSANIHPTQKPIALYKWLLKNYAKEGDLILDTHVGSASSLIACEDMGFEYVGYELDKDYYDAAQKRLKEFRSQLKFNYSELADAK